MIAWKKSILLKMDHCYPALLAFGRFFASGLKALGQPIMVEDKSGGASVIAKGALET